MHVCNLIFLLLLKKFLVRIPSYFHFIGILIELYFYLFLEIFILLVSTAKLNFLPSLNAEEEPTERVGTVFFSTADPNLLMSKPLTVEMLVRRKMDG